MNEELETKEYLASLESLKLADSSRLRMQESLLEYARFHSVPESALPVKSPFTWLALKPVQAAFAFVVILGTSSAVYFNTLSRSPVVTLETPQQNTPNPSSPTITPLEVNEPDFVPNPPTSREVAGVPQDTATPEQSESIAFDARAKSAQSPEAAMADDAIVSTMVSQGTWSVSDYQHDITRRVDALETVIKKYDSKFSSEQKTTFTEKLTTAKTLRNESVNEADTQAYELLDKATVLVGEVEADLSLLGQVIVNEEGIIKDIDFSVDPTKPHEAGEAETGSYPPEAAQ